MKLILSAYIVGLLFMINNQANALVIGYSSTHTNSITTTGVYSAGNVDSVFSNSLTPFDSSLGTLDDIQINITGDVIFSGTAGLNLTFCGIGCSSLPYAIESEFILGLHGLNNEYFSFLSPLTVNWKTPASGTSTDEELAPYTASFNFSFDFDDLLTAFILSNANCIDCSSTDVFSPPSGISGGLQEFIDSNILQDKLLLHYQLNFLEGGKVFGDESSITADSTINIETVYTYSAVQVPEPSALALLGLGLAGFGFISKRNKTYGVNISLEFLL